jgi:hypothetical protein
MTGHTAAMIVWAVLFAALVGWQLVALRRPDRWIGLGRLVGIAMSNVVGRVVLLLTWMWLGWHLFAR